MAKRSSRSVVNNPSRSRSGLSPQSTPFPLDPLPPFNLSTLSRTQVLLTKISQTCQSIRNIKKTRKQLGFHRTSNTSKRTTSCSSQRGHSILHSGTGDEDGRDDNAKKSNSSTSSSVGGTHTPDTPTRCDPTPPVPVPIPTSISPSPGRDPRSPPPDDKGDSSPAS